MMTIVVIALTIQIIIIAHIHTITRDSNPDSPGSQHVCHTTEPSAGRKPSTRAQNDYI